MKSRLALLLILLLLAFPVAAAQAEGEHSKEGSSTELLFKWLNFFLVFGPAAYFGGPWLKRKFAEIRQGIRAEIESARRQRDSSQQRLAEIEQRLAGLEQEIDALRQEAAANATAEANRIRDTAQREAERLLATARAEIESTSRAARLELRTYMARMTVKLAEQHLQERLTPTAHNALFQSFLSNLATPAAGRQRRQ
ncbi:MAG: hypothetical protein ACE5IP_11890 [Terriglobia bacterium]